MVITTMKEGNITMRLIPSDKRLNYVCACCGGRHVKYFIPAQELPEHLQELGRREYAFCSMCALRLSLDKREHDTFMEDEQR